MGKCFGVGAVAALLASSMWMSGTAFAASAAEVFARAQASVLELEVTDEQGARLGAHTAVVVAPGRAVSVCDALDGAPALRVAAGGRPAGATILARDRRRNLCLLAVTADAPALQATAAGRAPTAGQRIFAISNASGLGVGISEGVVSGVRSFPAGDYVQFSAPISPGSEGGALVDETGRLVGVIDYRQRDGQNVNFAASAGWIAEIESRADRDGERQALRDSAARLGREQRWAELAALAEDWRQRHGADAESLAWQAAAAAMRGETDSEERAWRELRKLDPASLGAGLGLARCLLRRGAGPEALALVRGMLELRREDGELWSAIGDAEQAAGTLENAEEAYRKALSLNPWLSSAHEGLIALAQRRGDRAGVTAGWRRLAQLYPDVPGVRWRLVEAHLWEGRPARAWALLQDLPESPAPAAGDEAAAWYWKGAVLSALGRPAEAVTAYRRSLESKPAAPAWAWAGIGAACLELKRFPEAIEAYRQAAALDPDRDTWRFWLAVALKDGGHVEEALEIDRQLVARHPKDPDAWRQLGFANATAGRAADSIAALERSLELEPGQGKTWAALMEQYHAAGRRDDARRAFDKLRGVDAERAAQAYRAVLLPYAEAAR